MANILRFVILGDDRGGPAFASFTKQVEKANAAVDRNNAALKRQSAAAKGARGGIAGLAGEVTGFGAAADAASSGGNKFKLALAGLNLASGVLEPAMAGIVVAAGGLAAGFAAAGAGLGVFGAVAKTVFTEASKAATAYAAAQQKYANATTSKQRIAALQAEKNAMAGLSPPVKALAIQLGNTKSQWKKFTDAAAPGVVGVIGKGLGLLPKILAAMKPFLAPTEAALRGIIGQLSKGLSSSGFKSFIDAFAKNSGPAITKIAKAIGNVVVGIGGILKAFLPTSQTLLTGIDKITAKFRIWGTTLTGHSGFQSLMTTFKTETPQAVAILKNLGMVIANVGKAMFGLSTFSNSRLLLNLLTPLSGVMASLSKNTNLVRVAMYGLLAVKIGQQFSWVKDAWKGIVKFAAVTEGATVAETIAAAATRAWGLAMTALPWVALAAAVVTVALLIIKYHRQIWAFVQKVWHDILAVITSVLRAITQAWTSTWNRMVGLFRGWIVNGILGPLGWIIHAAASAFGWIPGLGGKLKGAARAFDAFRANVNKSLGGINGRTVKVGVAMTSSTNPYPGGISGRKAAGGRITGPGGPTDDRAGLFALSNNEWVIRADSAARYGHAAMAAVNEGRAHIGYAGGGVAVRSSAPGYAAINSNLLASVTKLATAFAKAANAAGGHVSYNPSAGISQWRGVVTQALRMLGLSPGLVLDVLYQMLTESGGNPNIVNKWDSNWLAGHPSVGLMQVIRGTYQAYAGPFRNTGPFSYGVSVNPLANVYAALNYARHGRGFGTGYGQIGSGHGYAYGTGSAAPGWAWVGERGPELVRFRGGESVTPAGAGNTYQITVNVPPTASKAAVGREIVEHIREYERGSGKGWRR